MKIFNTLTRQKETLVPLKEGEYKIYACGPTVYNFIHIGNARPLCVFDVLRRYLEYRGYDVTFVQNFTDVDSLQYFLNLQNDIDMRNAAIAIKEDLAKIAAVA